MDKVLRGTPLHLSKNGQLKDFTYLMINLPYFCNFRCSKCFNLENNIFHTIERPVGIKKIFSLIKEAKDIGGKVVVLAGEGEPILNKNFKKIVRKINLLKMIPIVYSNGSNLNKNLIKFLAENNATLVISFDSLSSDLYLKLTGIKDRNIFKRVLDNISKARKIYKEFIEYRNGYKIVRLAINTTVTSFNKNEIKKIKNFCGDDIYFICNPLAELGNAACNWGRLIKNNKDYKEIEEIVKNLSETGGPLTLGRNGLCGYSINGIAVSPSGDYMTCAYTSLTDGLFSSIFNKSLREAYNYKRKQEQKFYNNFGKYPCLIRSPKFNNYLNTLKNLAQVAQLVRAHSW